MPRAGVGSKLDSDGEMHHQQQPTTFLLFPRLPTELRIHIWALATEERVVRVGQHSSNDKLYASPTPAPAVTRACQESRRYCSYDRAFRAGERYIWMSFSRDIIQLDTWAFVYIDRAAEARLHIRHLRMDMKHGHRDADTSEYFDHCYALQLSGFPRLERLDALVVDGLQAWTDFIGDGSFGTCPNANVRVVDRGTGEYITEVTSGVYQGWVDTRGGTTEDLYYTRIVDYEEDEEDRREKAGGCESFPVAIAADPVGLFITENSR